MQVIESPPIADVKAAVKFIATVEAEREPGTVFEFAYGCDHAKFHEHAATLMRFAVAVIETGNPPTGRATPQDAFRA